MSGQNWTPREVECMGMCGRNIVKRAPAHKYCESCSVASVKLHQRAAEIRTRQAKRPSRSNAQKLQGFLARNPEAKALYLRRLGKLKERRPHARREEAGRQKAGEREDR